MIKTGGIMDRLISLLSSDYMPSIQLKCLEVLLYFDGIQINPEIIIIFIVFSFIINVL
jgi:hypothetical protein